MEPKELTPPFTIYNASAGSGKTFLLVQKYLAVLLKAEQPSFFHRLLALTFTNKAVFEMKFRILEALNVFCKSEALEQNAMAKMLCEELQMNYATLRTKAKTIIDAILHDYGAFDIITLDRFTHRVIRTFAKELGLRYDFEVALNEKPLLQATVNDIIEKVGRDEDLSRLLRAFTFDKMDVEGSTNWDLKKSLYEVARLLLKENDRKFLNSFLTTNALEKKQQAAFLSEEKSKGKTCLIALGKETMLLLHENGLSVSDFYLGTIYKKFDLLSNGNWDKFDSGTWGENLKNNTKLYKKTTPEHNKSTIDALWPTLLATFEKANALLQRLRLMDDIEKTRVPLGLLSQLAKTLDERQKKYNKLLLATFNERIKKEVLNNPTPLIYERLGENYRHYFIDEFQDTSTLQWENLIPLLSASAESLDAQGAPGSILLVGDPKQSIYRWRGGNVDQFISLLGKKNPFSIEKELRSLAKNYRSHSAIVAFNNTLFSLLPSLLEHDENKALFGEKAHQSPVVENEGYVRLNLFSEQEEKSHEACVVESIRRCYDLGTSHSDMAILVRTKDQGICMAKALSEDNIPFVSSESLLLAEAPSIQFLIALMSTHQFPDEAYYKKEMLRFLYPFTDQNTSKHEFLKQQLDRSISSFLTSHSYAFSLSTFEHSSLFTAIEKAVHSFPLLSHNDPYVMAFLDLLFEFDKEEKNDLSAFLNRWEEEGKNTTLSMGDQPAGVRILTIHKAKGLEFPVVFFPYADIKIHKRFNEKVWLDTSSFFEKNYPLSWIRFTKQLQHYGEVGEQAYHNKLKEQEIDAWNVFYVATTRAAEQLHLFAEIENAKDYSYVSLFEALLQAEGKHFESGIFEWGTMPPQKEGKQKAETIENSPSFHTTKALSYTDRLLLQKQSQNEKNNQRLYGILIHDLLARIFYADQIAVVLEEGIQFGEITAAQAKQLLPVFDAVMKSPSLAAYYSPQYRILNEHPLLVEGKNIVRPDRIAFNDDEAVVIDYKTGEPKAEHHQQVQMYCKQVTAALKKSTKGFLVYLPEEKVQGKKPVEIISIATE